MTEEDRKAFGRRLRLLLEQKGMSQSDLARLIWGTTTTRQGHTVAKNRDRIAVWIKGTAFPTQGNLKKVAAAIGVEIADLAPEYLSDAIGKQSHPLYSVTKSQGDGDKVFLRVNKLVPETIAAQIIALLAGAP